MVTLTKARRGINRFGARKYTLIPSETTNEMYKVAKVRIRNRKDYKYVCSCADYIYRQHQCKHIKTFKALELV
jgi:hypothetical protein